MHQYYHDILKATEKKPLWWQEGGVPRFEQFNPNSLPDIYADEAVLAEIECQNCGEKYLVCFTSSDTSRFDEYVKRIGINVMYNLTKGIETDLEALSEKHKTEKYHLSVKIKEKTLHYGDPPDNNCCEAGATMNSIMIRVVEYWSRNNKEHVAENGRITDYEAYRTWKRNPELEIIFQ